MNEFLPTVLSKQSGKVTSAKGSYHTETLRPIVSLAFVAPILLVYELACVAFRVPIRTGVDQWLHQLLSTLGIGQVIILPLVTAGALLLLHHRQKDEWEMDPHTLLGMLAESVGLGMILFFGAQAYHLLAYEAPTSTVFAIAGSQNDHNWLTNALGYFGAGIYEELIFRLFLFTGFIVLLTHWTKKKHSAIFIGLLITSLLFAVSHYNVINPAGNAFEVSSFLFRFLASVLFCIVFLYRGFGIAVGTHVAYDVLTQL